MDYTQQPIRHLSVCSGYEGLGLGLRRVFPSIREIAYIEIEAFAIANLANKMETEQLHPAPIYTDVKTFPFRQFRGTVDILSGGFPCQPFSVAGGRQGTDDERHVYPAISAGIRECQPTVVFLENVPGIISTKLPDGTPVLQHVLQDLEGMGYTATAGIFSAEEVSAPHRRDRVFILAYAGSQRLEGVESGVNHPKEWKEPNGSTAVHGRTITAWPARPGHEQHEWEEPRTIVVNTQRKRSQGSDGDAAVTDRDQPQDGVPTQAGQHNDSQAQPKLGGTTNGDTSGVAAVKFRVDRLRMIGNGVVPETAERAYQVLAGRLRGGERDAGQ